MPAWYHGVKRNPALLPFARLGQSCTDGTDRGDPQQRPSPPTGPGYAPRHGGHRSSSAPRKTAPALKTGATAFHMRPSRGSHGNPAGCRCGQTPLRCPFHTHHDLVMRNTSCPYRGFRARVTADNLEKGEAHHEMVMRLITRTHCRPPGQVRRVQRLPTPSVAWRARLSTRSR